MKLIPSMLPGFNIRSSSGCFGACSVCKSPYDPWSVHEIVVQEERYLLHIVCQKCRTAILALISVQNSEVKAMELITDLNQKDVLKFDRKGPICADDVLELHDQFRNWSFCSVSQD